MCFDTQLNNKGIDWSEKRSLTNANRVPFGEPPNTQGLIYNIATTHTMKKNKDHWYN